MTQIRFGWRVPAFPTDDTRGAAFFEQITRTLDLIQTDFDSAWVADHFIPWAGFLDNDTDTFLKTWGTELVAVGHTESEARMRAQASPYYNGGGIIGTPAQVAEQLSAFCELGCEYFIVRFADFPDTAGVRLFADEVIPLFR